MSIPARRLGQLNVTRDFSFTTRHVELPAEEFIYRQGVSGILLVGAGLLALLGPTPPGQERTLVFGKRSCRSISHSSISTNLFTTGLTMA